MKFIIGSGDNEIDWTYVGNVAQSHLDVSLGGKEGMSLDSWTSTIGVGRVLSLTGQKCGVIKLS